MSAFAKIVNIVLEVGGIAFGVCWAFGVMCWAFFVIGSVLLHGGDQHKSVLSKMFRSLYNVSCAFLLLTALIWFAVGASYTLGVVSDEMPLWLYIAIPLGVFCFYYRMNNADKNLDA